MDFVTAIKNCISKYFVFHGRAQRAEYWYFVLFNLFVSLISRILDGLFDSNYLFRGLAFLLLTVPLYSAGVRRLHDRRLIPLTQVAATADSADGATDAEHG
jgi:uncharacterized membrane protein YhaH (DUF805 family)